VSDSFDFAKADKEALRRSGARVAALIGKGRGQTLQSLLQASEAGAFGGVEGSNRLGVVIGPEGARGLALTQAWGVDAATVTRAEFKDKQSFETALLFALRSHRADLVVLCGFMHLLSAEFLEQLLPVRALNLHPGLLPAFAGKDPQAQALAYGVKVVGTTVHFVEAGTDTGPILLQDSYRVGENETLETMTSRLRSLSMVLYPKAIRRVLEGKFRLEGRKVVLL
jgi:phosphoribosylglycinamide formyltransferase-1